MEADDTTFFLYQDDASVFHVVDELRDIPRDLREAAQAVEVTADEAYLLRTTTEEEGTNVVEEIQLVTGAPFPSIRALIDPPGMDFGIIGLGLGLVVALVVFRNMAKSGGHRVLTHIITSFIFSALMAVGYNAVKQYQGTQAKSPKQAQMAPSNELEKKGQEAMQRLQKRQSTQRKVLDAIKREKDTNRR